MRQVLCPVPAPANRVWKTHERTLMWTTPCTWPLRWNMSSTRAEPRGACCAQFSDRIYRSEPKLPCIRAIFVSGLRMQLQHGTHSGSHYKERGSKLSRASPYGRSWERDGTS
ncbi:hypothetical protein EVAR_23984_1 [Eumeta japonica]|uniref:Uncharacterized protein n=1 Tax=Eumeta variegata TaxID=151549 RepID=A0A4C1V2T0_EUMVA|nr:hypothetical protein EVAR_23984_1 [Eumeta japonica]